MLPIVFGVNNAAYYFFDFGTSFEHLLRITVAEVRESFGLAFRRNPLQAGTDFGIDGYTCLAYFENGQCVEYESLNSVAGFYEGPVTWLIAWAPGIGTEAGEIVHRPDGEDTFTILNENRFFDFGTGPRNYNCDFPGGTTPCGSFIHEDSSSRSTRGVQGVWRIAPVHERANSRALSRAWSKGASQS